MTKKIKWSRDTSDTVNELLVQYSKDVINKASTTKEGNLDINALQKMPETIALITKFKKLGIKSKAELLTNGFIPAGMILKF